MVAVFSDYCYPYATLLISILSTAAVLAKNKITVSRLFSSLLWLVFDQGVVLLIVHYFYVSSVYPPASQQQTSHDHHHRSLAGSCLRNIGSYATAQPRCTWTDVCACTGPSPLLFRDTFVY